MLTSQQLTMTDPAPTISINILSNNGLYHTQVLPDSGADISAAGQQILHHLNENFNNLLPSGIVPHTANGDKMQSLGKMLIKFSLEGKEHSEDMHIYPNVSGIIISWRAAKALGILPEHYSKPIPLAMMPRAKKPTNKASIITTTSADVLPTHTEITQAFPSVFSGQIRLMEGEEFHISLVTGTKPFCINTPRSIS